MSTFSLFAITLSLALIIKSNTEPVEPVELLSPYIFSFTELTVFLASLIAFNIPPLIFTPLLSVSPTLTSGLVIKS